MSEITENTNIEKETVGQPYFEKGDIRTGGYIFEEFYFDLDQALLSKSEGKKNKTFHVGDVVPVVGESYRYPDYFDIISLDDNAAILIRNRKIADITSLEDYEYQGLPVVDEKGFAMDIPNGTEDFKGLLLEYYTETEPDRKQEFHNRWFKFETYRRIICTDNFWTI